MPVLDEDVNHHASNGQDDPTAAVHVEDAKHTCQEQGVEQEPHGQTAKERAEPVGRRHAEEGKDGEKQDGHDHGDGQ